MRLVVYDNHAHRFRGGHTENYIAALGAAFPGMVHVFEPYANIDLPESAHVRPSRLFHLVRWRWYACDKLWPALRLLDLARRLLADRSVLINQTIDPLDFLLLPCLKVLTGARFLMLVRRDLGGPGLRARLELAMVRFLYRRRYLTIVSDSKPILDGLDFVRESLIIPLPPLASPATAVEQTRQPSAPICFGFVGYARMEKGLAYYQRLIAAILEQGPAIQVLLQLRRADASPLKDILDALYAGFASSNRVEILESGISAATYARRFADLDIVVAPYIPAMYGNGTTSVIQEAVDAGKIVIATRVRWAVERFAASPLVVWMDAFNDAEFDRCIAQALAAARRQRIAGGAAHGDGAAARNAFKQAWAHALLIASEKGSRP